MNERIQELSQEAKCYADENSAHYLQNPHWIETFEEKFAELIVRECADVAWMNTPETEELDYSHLISDKIKEHFGIEE